MAAAELDELEDCFEEEEDDDDAVREEDMRR